MVSDTIRVMDFLTVKEAADKLQVTVGRIHQLIKAGRLPAVKFGFQYVIKQSDLMQIRDRKPGRPPKMQTAR